MSEWRKALENEDNEELRQLFQFDQRQMRKLAKTHSYHSWDSCSRVVWVPKVFSLESIQSIALFLLSFSCQRRFFSNVLYLIAKLLLYVVVLQLVQAWSETRFESVHEEADSWVDLEEFRKACRTRFRFNQWAPNAPMVSGSKGC